MKDRNIVALTLVYKCPINNGINYFDKLVVDPRSKQVTVMIDCKCGQQHSIILFDGFDLGKY